MRGSVSQVTGACGLDATNYYATYFAYLLYYTILAYLLYYTYFNWHSGPDGKALKILMRGSVSQVTGACGLEATSHYATYFIYLLYYTILTYYTILILTGTLGRMAKP